MTQFVTEVEQRSGQRLKPCYQCLKCSAGCPLGEHMEYPPNSLIRLMQYGEREKVLNSHAIWLCVSCMTCAVRCPNDVDMSVVMDTLREMSIETGRSMEAEKRVFMLHEEFVRSIRFWGRLHEATFFMAYMARSFDIIANVASGLALILKGKIKMVPRRIKGIRDLSRIIKATYTGGKKEKTWWRPWK